ncbi:hypothetical protein [Cohnella caldifontis]|nr:hypothetical protein [Cohnella sp. YIM B05605]
MMEKNLSIRTSTGDITIDPQEPPAAADIDLRTEVGKVEADTEAGRILPK